MLQRFPVIVGPTAGGKTSLAVALAHALRTRNITAHVISADSMQIYKGMDIGTAKPSPDEQAGVRHHLIDLVEPSQTFSVDRWLALAQPLIETLRADEHVPIVVGGTHLYAKALLEGLFEAPEPDPEIRARLQTMDPVERRRRLEDVDPDAARRIHPNDARRTIRALEVWESTGLPISKLQQQWDTGRVRPDALLVGLDWPTPEINKRINERVRRMIDQGLVAEVRALHEADALGEQARQALGYRQILDHLEGRATLDEAVEKIKIETRRFAKNQRTWLRRLRTTPGALWLEAADASPKQMAQVVMDKLLTHIQNTADPSPAPPAGE